MSPFVSGNVLCIDCRLITPVHAVSVQSVFIKIPLFYYTVSTNYMYLSYLLVVGLALLFTLTVIVSTPWIGLITGKTKIFEMLPTD